MPALFQTYAVVSLDTIISELLPGLKVDKVLLAQAIDAMPEYVRLYGFRYARATTGHPAVDPLRGVMLKMYRDNHYWMRDQVQEAAEQSGVECDKWMLHALLKQMCVRSGAYWVLKDTA